MGLEWELGMKNRNRSDTILRGVSKEFTTITARKSQMVSTVSQLES